MKVYFPSSHAQRIKKRKQFKCTIMATNLCCNFQRQTGKQDEIFSSDFLINWRGKLEKNRRFFFWNTYWELKYLHIVRWNASWRTQLLTSRAEIRSLTNRFLRKETEKKSKTRNAKANSRTDEDALTKTSSRTWAVSSVEGRVVSIWQLRRRCWQSKLITFSPKVCQPPRLINPVNCRWRQGRAGGMAGEELGTVASRRWVNMICKTSALLGMKLRLALEPIFAVVFLAFFFYSYLSDRQSW